MWCTHSDRGVAVLVGQLQKPRLQKKSICCDRPHVASHARTRTHAHTHTHAHARTHARTLAHAEDAEIDTTFCCAHTRTHSYEWDR